MNRYLRSVTAGAAPSIEEWHEHLVLFHRTFPDATTLPMTVLQAPGGVTSYRYFAMRLGELMPSARSVLDVGCGDGTLLSELRNTYGEQVHLAGIDLSECDIERARERLVGADLRCGDVAAALYPSESFDLIVGHLSFALIPNLRRVLSSMFRALRVGGALAFVIEDPISESTIFRALAASMAPIRRRFPAFSPSMPNREPWEDDAVLGALLREAGFSDGVRIERFSLQALLSPDELWEIARRSYAFGLLEDDLQSEAATALRAASTNGQEDGRSAVTMSLRLVVAIR
jgi:SAM-dependent methyltransferase